MTAYQNIPLGNAVSRAVFRDGVLEIEGTSRCYEWGFGERAKLGYEEATHRIALAGDDMHKLARLIESSREPYDPGMDFCDMRAGSDSDYLGTVIMQMHDLDSRWYCAGLSVLRDRDIAMLYARFDTGRGMDEREAYDTIVPLTQEECKNLGHVLLAKDR